MERGLILRSPSSGWAVVALRDLHPGGHVAVFGDYRTVLDAEDAGFEVRDCIMVLGVQRYLVWLCRKPLEAVNTVSQILATGTGGIFIDGCRVGYQSDADKRSSKPGSMPGANVSIGTFRTRDRSQEKPEDFQSSKGRWPPNLVLVHALGCRREGTVNVPSTSISKNKTLQAVRRSGVHTEAGGHQTIGRVQPVTGYANEDGSETITNWVCSPECVISRLDEQSGFSASTGGPIQQSGSSWKCVYQTGTYDRICDSGGASRFFPQFADEVELDAWLSRLLLGDTV